MFDWNEIDSYASIVNALQHDKVLLASSDTVLGLFAQLSEKSKNKLDAIKIRNLKPYIILIKSQAVLDDFIDQELNPAMLHLIEQYWPGPLTIIFKAKPSLPCWMKSLDNTIAIRVPDHKGLQKLLTFCNGLFTTSANISDQPLPKSYGQINPAILNQVEVVCLNPSLIYDGPASTIVDFSSGSIKTLRVGAIAIDSICI